MSDRSYHKYQYRAVLTSALFLIVALSAVTNMFAMPALAATGTGLTAQYFESLDLTELKTTRTDPMVNFASATVMLAGTAITSPDNFSVRWSGQIRVPATGVYTFYTVSDDGVRLWINNQQLLDNWTDHGATENIGRIKLRAGQKYDLRMEYYQHTGEAVVQLLWAGPRIAKQTVPQAYLYPLAQANAWSNPATWGGSVPTSGAVIIPAGKTVMLDQDVTLSNLIIEGTLTFDDSKDINLAAEYIMAQGGKFQIGSASAPYQHRAVVTLTGSDQTRNVMGMGNKFLGAMGGGTIEMYGASSSKVSWTQLAATAPIGATELTLAQATGWQVGDSIVLASTDFNPWEAEAVTVTGVNGNVVTIAQPLRNLHFGQMQNYNGMELDERAEVGLLSRNIVVQGDESSNSTGFGGHTMIMDGSHGYISGVFFYQMGQNMIRSRYPVHFHLLGESSGNYVRNSSIYGSFSRAITVHGTNNVTVAGNVAYNIAGHGIFLEDGTERRNIIDNNLVVLVRELPNGGFIPSDRFPANFWTASPDNIFTNNAAAGSAGGFGFSFDPTENGGTGPTAGFNSTTLPFGVFSNNRAHSAISADWQSGDGLWFNNNYTKLATVENFTSFRNQRAGIYLSSGGKVAVNARLASQAVGFTGWDATLRNSLVVARSANPNSYTHGTEATWNGGTMRALHHYDGFIKAYDTTFVNFKPAPPGEREPPRAGVYYVSFAHNESDIHSEIGRATMINSNPVIYEGGGEDGRTYVVRDADGSLSGTGRAGWMVNERALLRTNGCQAYPESKAYFCPEPDHKYGWLVFVPQGIDGQLAPVIMTRDDGASGQVSGGTAQNGVSLSYHDLMVNRSFQVSTGATMRGFTTNLDTLAPTDWVIASYAFPHANHYLYADYSQQMMSPAESLSELQNSSTSTAYFENGRVHVKLFGGGFLRVCSTVNCE